MARWKWILGIALFGSSWLWAFTGNWIGSIWPSVVALCWVMLSGKVVWSLVIGAASGALILKGGNPAGAFVSLFEVHLMPLFGSSWKSGAIIFTLVLGGFVGLIEGGGSLRSLFARCLHSDSPRKMQAGAAMSGLICFFDGLANSLMVGRLFRGPADRLGVPRVKLAYIADTTSSAVACLAFISTWIAYQLGLIQEGLSIAGVDSSPSPYHLFFSSLPFNFYCWYSLGLMGVLIGFQWDFGPMRRYTVAAAQKVSGNDDLEPEVLVSGGQAWRAGLPLLVLVVSILWGIYQDGISRLDMSPWPLSGLKLAEAFGKAEAAMVLVWSSVLATIVAFLCYPGKVRDAPSAEAAFVTGVQSLLAPVLILVAAWMLSSVLSALGSSEILGNVLADRLPLEWLPAAVFVVGALTSFTTGTSWGTMGLLMPLAVPLVFSLGGDVDPEVRQLALSGVIGAVFSGAVFGDHCSPLSDTTIVSSISCDVETTEHVRTQLPYALLAAGAALLIGFVPMFWFRSPAWLVVLGLCVFISAGAVLGRKGRNERM